MRQQFDPVIIFTTHQINLTPEENNINFEKLKTFLGQSQIRFKEVMNMHFGVSEPSVVISAEYEDVVKDIAIRTNQELYIILDQDRNAILVNPKNDVHKEVGVFKGVDARYQGDRVFDPTTGIHYAIV